MKIDISALQKIGNMTSGAGLSALGDGNTVTPIYTQSGNGWAGVSFEVNKRIDKVSIYSPDNGFDASGSNTGITIQLFAKPGGPPTVATDGILLGSISFTDQNVARSIEIQSSDKITEFDHAWVRVLSGVWSAVTELDIYEAAEPVPEPAPVPLPAGSHVFISSCDSIVPLVRAGVEISQLRTKIYLSEPRVVLLDFHADVRHDGVGSDANVAVGYSFALCIRSDADKNSLAAKQFEAIRNAAGGGNISERNPQHYGNSSICTALNLPAGFHEFTVIGNGHTDGTSTDGVLVLLAEGGKGLNCLRVAVLP